MYRKTFFTILSVFYSFVSFAQSNFINYTKENGLPSNTVYCSLQDNDGFLWFGTDKGVAQFNGFEFKTFTIDDGLTDNEIFRMFQDSKKRIWFLTHNGKLCYYLNGVIFNEKNSTFLGTIQPSSFFTHIVEKPNGDLLFFKESSTQFYILQNQVFELIYLKDVFTFNSIYKDDQQVYVFSLKLSANSKKKYVLYKHDKKLVALDSFYNNNSMVHYLNINKQHVIIDRGQTGIEKLHLKYGTTLTNLNTKELDVKNGTTSSFPVTVCVLKNEVFIPSSTGLFILTPDLKLNDKLLKNIYCTSVLKDFESGLWVTTKNNGVYYSCITNSNKIEGAESNIYKIIKDPFTENLFFATSIGKYYSYDYKSNTIKINEIKSKVWNNELISDIAFIGKKDYLISSTAGVLEIKNNTEFFAPSRWKGGIKKIEFDGDTVFYARSNSILKQHKKLIHKNSDIQTQQDEIIFKKRTFSICKTKKGELLFGALDGVYKYQSGFTSKLFPGITTRINGVKESPEGILAFSSDLDGVYLSIKDSLIHITSHNELISNQVNGICFDKNKTLWVATAKGISKINYLNKITIENFSIPNGLPDPFINDILPINDSLLFLACPSGLYTFNYKNKINSVKPFLNLSQIKVNSKIISAEALLHLSHNENNIEISFVGISYASKKNIEYWYSFGNDSTIWYKTNSSTLNFPSLSPGNYKLSIKCKNIQGTWSTPIILNIGIKNPFYKTSYFLLILITSCLIFALLLFYYYKKKIEKENNVKLLISETKQKALRAQLNPHFIFNALNSIQYLFLSKKEETAQDYLSKFSTMLRNTLNNSDKAFITLNEELLNLKTYMELEQIRKVDGFQFDISIHEEVDAYSCLVPSMLLQPVVENAIWHGLEGIKKEGKIIVAVSKIENDMIKITISDNGIGINNSRKSTHQSKGTSLIYDRLNAINITNEVKASINITDTGKGTKVDIVLPLKFI